MKTGLVPEPHAIHALSTTETAPIAIWERFDDDLTAISESPYIHGLHVYMAVHVGY